MACPICDQKPMNCDCTDAERRQYAEIQELEERMPRWIPVEERLPEQHHHVIGWQPGFARAAEVWIGSSGQWLGGDFEPAGDITHWMSLPEPPEVK